MNALSTTEYNNLLKLLKERKEADYWQDRVMELEKASTGLSVDYLKRLEKEYSEAAITTQAQLNEWYGRYATTEGITLQEARRRLDASELKSFRNDVNSYIKKGQDINYSKQWENELKKASIKAHVSRLEAIQFQLRQQVEALYGKEMEDVDDLLFKLYKDRYYQTAFEVSKGFGINLSFAKIDDKRIRNVLKRPWTADGNTFSKNIWKRQMQLTDELQTLLTQSLIQGEPPSKLVDAIAKRYDVKKHQAENLVMTESAYFGAASQQDAFNELDIEEYEVVATLDNRTSDICQHLDGHHFPMSEYKPGVTAPPFHCRCRTTTAPYFDDEFEVGTMRAARDENGKTIMVPADMKYGEWYDLYAA